MSSVPSVPAAQAASAGDLSTASVARLIERAEPGTPDTKGWAGDILKSLRLLGLPRNKENVCAAIAVIDQESGFRADPRVPDLGRRAGAEARKRIATNLLLKTFFLAAPAIEKDFLARVDAAKSEREIDLAYRRLLAAVLNAPGIKAGAGFIIDLDKRFDMGVAELFEEQNVVTTIGSMQVSVKTALAAEAAYLKRRLELADIYRVRDYLYTREGGVLNGLRHLLDYETGYSRKVHRFADFNAGHFASRNAALQQAVNRLGGTELQLDGDLLLYGKDGTLARRASNTELAIRAVLKAGGVSLSNWAIRADLAREKRADFTRTATFRAIRDLYRATFEVNPPFAVLPQIRLDSIKIDRAMTTADFARRVDGRYRTCIARVDAG